MKLIIYIIYIYIYKNIKNIKIFGNKKTKNWYFNST